MFQKFKDRLDVPISEWTIEYRVHATRRMFERKIEENDIFLAIDNGIIIEDYGNDYPFPSVLVSRDTVNERPIHVIIGIDVPNHRMYVITVYQPDNEKWTDNFKKRVKK